jgi:hypothetical protein
MPHNEYAIVKIFDRALLGPSVASPTVVSATTLK